MIFARRADPNSIDPNEGQGGEDICTDLIMYDCLYTAAADGHGSVPWLATSYDLSTDQKTWTFHLRPGVKFSDGRPVVAADWKYSIERAIKGPTGYIDAAIDAVDAPDAATVTIHTKLPWAPLLADISLFNNAVLPKDLNGMSSAEFFNNPVGTGAFMFDHWSKGAEIKLVKNPHYWQAGLPLLDSVTFTTVPDDNTRVIQLKGGQADIIQAPPSSTIASLQQTPGLKVDMFPSTQICLVGMNELRPHFADVHVRRAIAYAIDRKSIIQGVLFGHGDPANSMFSPGWAFYNPDNPGPSYDVAKAKQELAMSGFSKGFDTEMMVVAGDTANSSMAQIIQDNLKVLGINMKIKSTDPSTFYALQGKFDYDMYPRLTYSDIGDPDEVVPWALDYIHGGVHALYTSYKSPKMIALIGQSQRTIGDAARQDIYWKIQELVAQDVSLATIYYSPFNYGRKDSVNAFSVYPTGGYHLEKTWLSA